MAPVRHYLVTLRQGSEIVWLGSTSASEALKGLKPIRQQGWQIELIHRGTETITLSVLERDVETERRT